MHAILRFFTLSYVNRVFTECYSCLMSIKFIEFLSNGFEQIHKCFVMIFKKIASFGHTFDS